MKFLPLLAVAAATTVSLVHGQASMCMDPVCEVNLVTTCAAFFEAHYVWTGADYCCSFTEDLDGVCTMTTNSNCQYDSKAKYTCDPHVGPCEMVGPAMISAANNTNACPASDFEVPESSDVGTEGPPMIMANTTDTAAASAASSFFVSSMSALAVAVSSLALAQAIL